MESERLIKLEIAMDYPVNWSFEWILRDLMQNFFDASGSDNFRNQVDYHYTFTDNFYSCVMEASGSGFSYEWLTYIGGSTKTDHPGSYIGMYGEGFKICMLRLLQMEISNCRMESGEWYIIPCVYEEKIANENVRMLGYRLGQREDDGASRLTIWGIPQRHAYVLKELLFHFFYPGNKLFGRMLSDEGRFCVYRRNLSVPIPSVYRDSSFTGILYINRLARARLDLPLMINIQMDRRDAESRSRSIMERATAIRLLEAASYQISSKTSYAILIELEKRWADIPRRNVDPETWYYFICQLVRNVATDKKLEEKFRKTYTDLCYLDRYTSDRKKNSRIRTARYWYFNKERKTGRLVNPIFRLLGAVSVMKEFEEKEESEYRACTDFEAKRIALMFNFFEKLFPVPGLYRVRPEILIRTIGQDTGGKRPDPLQFSERDYSERPQRYRIQKLVILQRDLENDTFDEPFIFFCSALLNVFGTDGSQKKTAAMTALGERLIEERDDLEMIREGWRNVGKQRRLV